MRNVRNRGFKQCKNTEQSSVLACGLIVDGRRVTVHRSVLVGLLGLITCVRTGLAQEAELLGSRAEVRLSCAFGTGKHRQGSRGRQSLEWSRSDRQGTARMKGET